jgi:steroid delta-isomerase-like uncharacterized protein
MSDANVAVAMKFYEVYNDRKLELLDEILSNDYVGHVNANDIKGPEAAKGFIGGFMNGFPDVNYDVKDTMTSGDKVITRWVCTGTHKATFFGMEPTDKAISVTGITIFQITDGKISELWNNWDIMTMMAQLGKAGGGH